MAETFISFAILYVQVVGINHIGKSGDLSGGKVYFGLVFIERLMVTIGCTYS